MVNSAERHDEEEKWEKAFDKRLEAHISSLTDEDAKAGLAQHGAMVELGLGQFVELSFTAKITGIKYDVYKPELVLYRVEIRTKDGYYINSCDVDGSMIVR